MRRRIGEIPIDIDDRGDGMPVLMLHGFGIDRRSLLASMDPVFERRAGYRRIHVDLPGFGASPATPAIDSSDAMVDFVLALMDATIGDARLLIVGESWGAYLARGIVARRPAQVVGVALLCPVILATHADRNVPDHRSLEEQPGILADADPGEAADFREAAVVIDRGSWAYFHSAIHPALQSADPATVERIEARYAFAADVDRAGDPFSGPSLIVTGRQDSTVGYRDAMAILERFPRATFAVLDAAGHNLAGERRRLFAELMDDWLDRIERT